MTASRACNYLQNAAATTYKKFLQFYAKRSCKKQSMVRIQNILSGKWKITILWYISEYEIQRFGELRRRLSDITQSTLTKQLRELEQDGFISRYVYQEVPPKVEYSLTDLGKSFVPILQDMKKWRRV